MKNIDFYIKEVKDKNINSGNHRTKAYVFADDGVILINKYEENFAELKKRIQKCHDLGVNIPLYLDYKKDETDYWILEELAPGKEYASFFGTSDENIIKFYESLPYEHIEKYIHDSYLLEKNGIGIEPRYRNIFYDKEKGFSNIDVGLYDNNENSDSLIETSNFFDMILPVFMQNFSDDEYGQMVQEKTILNIMKAFENGHPFFSKYKRWIYRNKPIFASFLKEKGYNLTLDEKEYEKLLKMINELINIIVSRILDNPSTLFIRDNFDYISLLESSINYCNQFDLYDKNEKFDDYIYNLVFNKIKNMFFEDKDNNLLKDLYFKIRRNELDSLNIYPQEFTYKQINEEIEKLNVTKHMN